MSNETKIIPQLHLRAGLAHNIETFPHYVVRQLGLGGIYEGTRIGKLAEDYLRNPDGYKESIFQLFSHHPDAKSLYLKLVQEFEKCIHGYFAFHWSHSTRMVNQVLGVDSDPKTKWIRMWQKVAKAATRKQRFENIIKHLKVKRVFCTLREEMRVMALPCKGEAECTEVMVAAIPTKRSPVLLLMGGGMGVGKSTVIDKILQDSFWSEAASNAVRIEADKFKQTDVIYNALNSRGNHQDMLHIAEEVHQLSTDAASAVLVAALNQGRDVIMDGTLSWEPYFNEIIAMARNIHRHKYRMAKEHKVLADGAVTEKNWEQVAEEQENIGKRKPYRIELVGVVCDPYLAVVRGIRRAIKTQRAVRVKSQLLSHKRFANAFRRYCKQVDSARLYCNNSIGGRPPTLIGWKDKTSNLLVDPQKIGYLKTLRRLNEDADSIYDVYDNQNPMYEISSIWKQIVLSPAREIIHHELKMAITNKKPRKENIDAMSIEIEHKNGAELLKVNRKLEARQKRMKTRLQPRKTNIWKP